MNFRTHKKKLIFIIVLIVVIVILSMIKKKIPALELGPLTKTIMSRVARTSKVANLIKDRSDVESAIANVKPETENVVNSEFSSLFTKSESQSNVIVSSSMILSGTSSSIFSKSYEFSLILDPILDRKREEIFSFMIKDVTIPMNKISENIYYENMVKLLTDAFVVTDTDTINKCIEYKDFLKNSRVYSISQHKDIDQIYVIMLNIILNRVKGNILDVGCWKGGMSMFMKSIHNYYNNIKFPKDAIGNNGNINEKTLSENIISRHFCLFDIFDNNNDNVDCNLDQNARNMVMNRYGEIKDDKKIRTLVNYIYGDNNKFANILLNFKKLKISDKKVHYIKGKISETIPKCISKTSPINDKEIPMNIISDNVAVLRIGYLFYAEIIYTLETLYSRIPKGGIVVVSDYNNNCFDVKLAVDNFRTKNNIKEKIQDRHGGAVYWIKQEQRQ